MHRLCWLAVLVPATCLCAQAPALDYPALLARLQQLDWLWQVPSAGERCVQFSSYDRASDKGPSDPAAWYANDDHGKYLRVEMRDGKKEYVMVDAQGPGCIARIWSANPKGQLFFDIDGARAWTVDFAALLAGKLPPVGEPLAGMRSRGGNCHLPIPFQHRLVLSASDGDFYYHVNVVHLPAGTAVTAFHPDLLERHRRAIEQTGAVLRGQYQPSPKAMADGLPAKVEVPEGSIVQALLVQPLRIDLQADLGELLRQVLLVVRCGEHDTVRVPVLDFFNGGADWQGHHGYLLGIDPGGLAYCRWPMPMPQGGVVELVTDGDASALAGKLRLHLEVEHTQLAAREPLLFHASFHLHKQDATRPLHDHLVLAATGQGRFVGCALLVKNPVKAWWGEGDEKFWVDGERFPSTFGTGTEDYFGYAWCCTTPFSSALHAQPQCDGPGNYGFTAVNRMHVLDSVPFQKSFRFDLEVWHWADCKVDYASVAYWYGTAASRSQLPALPPATARSLDRLPPYPLLRVAGAIEAEQLEVVACSGGRHEVQQMGFAEQQFSGDAQRWWRDGKPGDKLVLALPVAAAGRYRLAVAFCRANDYGIVQVGLDGQRLGAPIDLYAEHITAPGALLLGELQLAAGTARLEFTITGKNDKALPAHMVGIDYVLLEAVR